MLYLATAQYRETTTSGEERGGLSCFHAYATLSMDWQIFAKWWCIIGAGANTGWSQYVCLYCVPTTATWLLLKSLRPTQWLYIYLAALYGAPIACLAHVNITIVRCKVGHIRSNLFDYDSILYNCSANISLNSLNYIYLNKYYKYMNDCFLFYYFGWRLQK